jgi:ElaB/YqjD/DUF883 family membrane-anchored ribosome-binding protein
MVSWAKVNFFTLRQGRHTMTDASTVAAQEKLVNDLKAVITDAEDMLHATANEAGDRVADLRARINDRLHDARLRLREAEALLLDKTRKAARATDAYVHESPWQSVGIGVGVGFLLGFILGRR